MDCERLISEVRRRRPIWQQSHPHHHNRGVLDKMWKEVAAKMYFPAKEVRLKWKYLRDQFRKELRKVPKSCSGDEDGTVYKTTWPYFDHLMFMQYQMMRYSSKKSSSSQSQKNEENSVDEGHEGDISDFNESVLSPAISTRAEPTADTSSDPGSINTKLLKMEERKLQLLARQSCSGAERCDDYHFFMSLLPVMKNFDDMQKLRIRSQIQQLIMDQMPDAPSGMSTYASTPSTITSNFVQCPNVMLDSSVSSLQSFETKATPLSLQYPTEYKMETHNY